MSPVLRGIYRRFVRVASAYHKECVAASAQRVRRALRSPLALPLRPLPARRRAGALLLATVRAEFRAAAPSGPPLSGADLAAAEATAARTFEVRPARAARALFPAQSPADTLASIARQFVRRAVFHGGTERALLRQLVHHADDWARRPLIGMHVMSCC